MTRTRLRAAAAVAAGALLLGGAVTTVASWTPAPSGASVEQGDELAGPRPPGGRIPEKWWK